MHPAKTQISLGIANTQGSLGIHPVWSDPLRGDLYVANLHADNEHPD